MDKNFNDDSALFPLEADYEEIDCVPVPVDRFEDLIRSETELAIMEAAIDELASYEAANVLKAIRTARAKFARVLVAHSPEAPEDTPDA